MKMVKVPSLQHLSRNWHPDPIRVKDELLKLVYSAPTFSYAVLYDLVRDLVVLKVPYDQVEAAVRSRVKRDNVRENYLALLPMISDYFEGVSPSFVHDVAPQQYSVARDLKIPFKPTLVYGTSTGLQLPWFSFWRSNPLTELRLSLFVSLALEIIENDADLEGANFQVLDFSSPRGGQSRSLQVIRSENVPRLSSSAIKEMLGIYAEGYRLAILEQRSMATEVQKQTASDERQGQLHL